MVDAVADVLAELARDGRTLVLVEQRVDAALRVADRVAVLVGGRLRHDGPAAEQDAAGLVAAAYFGAR